MASQLSIYDVLGVIADFDEVLSSNLENNVDCQKTIISHIQQMEKHNFQVPDFKPDLDWLNVSEPLSLKGHLKGQIVVLDFFTYCCINCMHILPDLDTVEDKYPAESGVVVVGVHSAKFLNEKVTANIVSAVLRYNIKHPVVNDRDAELWQELAVSCWPTLVFVSPNGQLLYSLPGEGHRAKILKFLEVASDFYSSQLHHFSLPISLERDKTPVSSLSFPGKICLWPERKQLVIADTGNHRIVLTDLSGVVQEVIGCGTQGLKDGNFTTAKFSSPQGVSFEGDCIFVADTGNHCLRQITLGDRLVSTISGTGKQGTDLEGGKRWQAQELSSPWDIVRGTSPDETASPVLYIAMAGSHQIWVYFVVDGLWYNDRAYEQGTSVRFAGSGLEENRNNSYPEKASFAQPSGLALRRGDGAQKLFVADSESSTIRTISLTDLKVSGLAGGERDPKNLFAYGDVDGKGINAKLQHPLGVALMDEKLIVADSYNHKIKWINLNTSECKTLAGTGQAGSKLNTTDLTSCEFNEPGGLSVNEEDQLIYVADTNNHAIKIIDWVEKKILQLPIVFSEETEEKTEEGNKSSQKNSSEDDDKLRSLPDVTVAASSKSLNLTVPVELKEGEHVNTEAPNSWKGAGLDKSGKELWNFMALSDCKGNLHSFSSSSQASLTLRLPSNTKPGVYTLKITVQVFVCLDKDNVCLPPRLTHFKQVLRLT